MSTQSPTLACAREVRKCIYDDILKLCFLTLMPHRFCSNILIENHFTASYFCAESIDVARCIAEVVAGSARFACVNLATTIDEAWRDASCSALSCFSPDASHGSEARLRVASRQVDWQA